ARRVVAPRPAAPAPASPSAPSSWRSRRRRAPPPTERPRRPSRSVSVVLDAHVAGHAGASLALDEARVRRTDRLVAGRAVRVGAPPAHPPAPEARAFGLAAQDFRVAHVPPRAG